MKANASILNERTVVSDERTANSIYSKGFIGVLEKAKLYLSLAETLYLIKKERLEVFKNNKAVNEEEFIKLALKLDKRFILRYKVYEDLKMKGYVVKTALKYGFDYRVYGKGESPGTKHAKWLVACYNENEKFTWRDFSKLMRISHSVSKSAITAIVDDEGDVTYWESNWNKI